MKYHGELGANSSCRYPLGTFRFLTRLDTVIEGDLWRLPSDGDGPYSEFDVEWTFVTLGIGRTVQELEDDYGVLPQVIRPIVGTTVPLYEED